MTSTAVAQAIDAIRAVADGVAQLEQSVARLEAVERARMARLQLALWDHRSASAPSNGHGKDLR
jgi:hypothetical protein